MTDLSNMILLTKQGGILKPFAILLGWIMQGIFWLLDKINIPNIGLCIIIFTTLVYVLLLPLTIKQQKFSKLSAKMNPELEAVRNKYKDKKDQESMTKMNMETQAIYSKYGVSPSGSCVQLIIQIPIIFSLYRVIYNMPAYVNQIRNVYVDIVNSLYNKVDAGEFLSTLSSANYYKKQFSNESFGVVEEFTKNTYIDVLNRAGTLDWKMVVEKYPDLTSIVEKTTGVLQRYNNFLGLNISDSPSYVLKTAWEVKNWGTIIGVILIPLFAWLTQWINSKLMPQPENAKGKKKAEEDPMMSSMKTLNTFMPIMSGIMCFTFPVGIGIYWIAGSVVRSVIQVCINKHLDKIDIEEMIKQNVEKMNKKREKLGLSPQQLTSNATLNTRNMSFNTTEEESSESKAEKANKRAQQLKESNEYYKNANIGKEGSLASKAYMVKQYNEKNNND